MRGDLAGDRRDRPRRAERPAGEDVEGDGELVLADRGAQPGRRGADQRRVLGLGASPRAVPSGEALGSQTRRR